MKRVIASALVLLMLCALAVPAFASAGRRATWGNVRNYAGSIATDGVMDEVYNTFGKKISAKSYWFKGLGEDKTGTDWADSYWLFSNDYKELHVFVQVHDNVIIPPPAEKHATMDGAYHTDSVEIWLDPNLNAADAANETVRENAYHYACDVSGFRHASLWGKDLLGNAACDPYFNAAVKMTSYGYDVEFVIYTDGFDATLQAGEKWGINLMMNDVYDARHDADKKEHWMDPDYYFMCSMLIEHENGTVSILPADFDNMILGSTVSDASAPVTDDDPAGKDDTSSTPFEDPSSTEGGTSKPSAPQTADPILFAAAAVLVSAGTAVAVLKKRRH